jgi:hypothetical protein
MSGRRIYVDDGFGKGVGEMKHNPNCDGGHCQRETGIVKKYPLGSGANLILCRSCWANENRYRIDRGMRAKSDNWPTVDWDTAEPYPEDDEVDNFFRQHGFDIS